MLIIGFALVAIPAAIGLITSAVSVTTLADRSEQAVYGAMVETRAGRRLAEAITVLERNARQFAILDDRELLGTYRQNRRLLAEALRELDAGEQVKSLVASVASIEDGIYVALSEPATTSAARRAAIERFAALHELAESVAQAGAQRIDSEVESLRTTARKVRRMAFSQLLALLPVIAFLVVGFTVLIARPIRDLDRAIRQLGRGHLSEPVRIDGPDDLAELGQRLDWMRRELIGLEQDKNHFLREIAHALKTPLTALRDGAELMQERSLGRLSPEQREVAEIMQRNALELQRLIEGLLQYGQAQFGRTALELVATALPDLVEQSLSSHELALRAKLLQTKVAVDSVRIRADAKKLKTILDNLVSNAIKYSPPGACVRVTAHYMDGQLMIEVADEGPGIAVEERERIFDPFVQGRAVASGPVPGSGIGLSIAREHVLAHGGTIELSDAEPGACFRVRLPVEPA